MVYGRAKSEQIQNRDLQRLITKPGKRVLMMAGAAFVHSVVFRQTEHLRKDGRYRFSAFGFGVPMDRPGDADPANLFEDYHPYPQSIEKHRYLRHAASIIPAVLPSFDPAEPQSWRERVSERARHTYHGSSLRTGLSHYDLYHWHCFEPSRLPLIRFLPSDAKLIVTLWGSDLFRTAGLQAYARQLAACPRVTAFTMASREMRETFLSKFGRELASKVRLLNYGACNLSLVAGGRVDREKFLAQCQISADKTIICLGNSGSPANQHVEGLKAIALLPSAILDRIAVLVPMTYGRNSAHMEAVKRQASQLSCRVHILEEFLEAWQMAALRASADITIHIPLSDQLSAAMCESLYAGSVLITGGWLPYSPLRVNGLHHHAIEELNGLPAKLASVIHQLDTERTQAALTSTRVWNMIAWESVTPHWLALYDEICAHQIISR